MSQTRLFAAFFFVVFLFLLYQLYRVFSAFLVGATWAAILTLVFYPFYQILLRRLNRPSWAAFLATAIIYLVAILPSVTLSGVLIVQARTFYEQLQSTVDSESLVTWVEWGRGHFESSFLARLIPPEVLANLDAREIALRGARIGAETVTSSLGGIAKNFLEASFHFTVMIVFLFFFFRDGERMVDAMRALIPMEKRYQDLVFRRLADTLSAVVQGMTATAVVQGLLCGLAFRALGVPFSALLGVAAGLASFIPIGGAALVWGPAVIYLVVVDHWIRALLLVVWGVGVVGLSDNVIKPLIIGDRTQIPTLFLLFGLLGGLQAYGVLGVFLGPALLATIIAFFRIYREVYLKTGDPALQDPSPEVTPSSAG